MGNPLNCSVAGAQDAAVSAPVSADAETTIVVLGNPDDMPAIAGQVITFSQISRKLRAESDRFTRCAPLPERSRLSAILDGPPTRERTQTEMHRYIASNKGCYSGQPELLQSPQLGVCNPESVTLFPTNNVCRVTYDRGALFERTLREVVGDLRLTREDTFDADVRARFLQRESARNVARGTMERRYFDTVACMVQIVPDAAVGMLLARAGSDRAKLAYESLIGNGGPCVGYAREVRADPDQFRAFVAEAVYSWITAKHNRDSLIVRYPAAY
ncbi:hypothetical protein [Croceibacterium ferulae]|uniref:hypothetical protein n=1 Tax=Croceibacterium ferulae TaxID=1854641 RepID=UPI000EB3E53F|nr:hypothetical protein [Croceibacterium ferulae]